MTTTYEQFIREAAAQRGIDAETAVTVAKMEGGVTEAAAHGDFDTGDSWWAYQLHYGGAEYPQYGTVAGMGGAFTDVSGWRPGDPYAWRDATRYALNRAKEGGWGPWYGAAAAGIYGYDGIDRSYPWDPNSEPWDFETGYLPSVADESEGAVAVVPVYTWQYPPIIQEESWDCSETSALWSLRSWGRSTTDEWLESQMLAEGVITPEYGLMDATGQQLADFLNRHYAELGYTATSQSPISWAELVAEASVLGNPPAAHGPYPLMIGGRAWGHWSGLRGFDGTKLLLANPAPGYKNVYQLLSEQQFAALGAFSAVRLRHPEGEAAAGGNGDGPRPPDGSDGGEPDPYARWRGTVGSGILEMMAADDGVLPAQSRSAWLPPGVVPAEIESCYGESGVLYTWLMKVSKGFRYRPE